MEGGRVRQVKGCVHTFTLAVKSQIAHTRDKRIDLRPSFLLFNLADNLVRNALAFFEQSKLAFEEYPASSRVDLLQLILPFVSTGDSWTLSTRFGDMRQPTRCA